MKRFVLFACLLLFPWASHAQDYGSQSINYCTMKMVGKKPYGYNEVSTEGRLGAYQFGVADLFDAGLCTGAPPAVNDTNWALCDFRGLTAVDNFVRGPRDILGKGDVQDMYMRLIRQKILTRHQALWRSDKMKPFLKYNNSFDLLAALMYRKGEKAVELYIQTGIKALDKKGYAIDGYWKVLENCAGGNKPNTSRRIIETPKSVPNLTVKVPMDFNWKPFTPAVAEQLKSYSSDKIDTISDLIHDNDIKDILYDTVDLNGDGKPGYQFMINGHDYCGSDGCMFIITENDGLLSKNITSTKIRPASNGVYVNGVYDSF